MTRQIERQMNDAILNSKDWSKDNTQVINIDGVSFVYLYSNLIAMIADTWMELFDGGHQTTTTKSRLNALLQTHGVGNEYVFQKKGEWFLNYQGSPIPFFDGMRLN
jgi:hypothetical protein